MRTPLRSQIRNVVTSLRVKSSRRRRFGQPHHESATKQRRVAERSVRKLVRPHVACCGNCDREDEDRPACLLRVLAPTAASRRRGAESASSAKRRCTLADKEGVSSYDR